MYLRRRLLMLHLREMMLLLLLLLLLLILLLIATYHPLHGRGDEFRRRRHGRRVREL
jgi:hypothetical protein